MCVCHLQNESQLLHWHHEQSACNQQKEQREKLLPSSSIYKVREREEEEEEEEEEKSYSVIDVPVLNNLTALPHHLQFRLRNVRCKSPNFLLRLLLNLLLLPFLLLLPLPRVILRRRQTHAASYSLSARV